MTAVGQAQPEPNADNATGPFEALPGLAQFGIPGAPGFGVPETARFGVPETARFTSWHTYLAFMAHPAPGAIVGDNPSPRTKGGICGHHPPPPKGPLAHFCCFRCRGRRIAD